MHSSCSDSFRHSCQTDATADRRQMAESFGLDRRIANLTGKRKVGFYSWDLDCLECVVSDIQESPADKEVADRIAKKIKEGYLFIKHRFSRH